MRRRVILAVAVAALGAVVVIVALSTRGAPPATAPETSAPAAATAHEPTPPAPGAATAPEAPPAPAPVRPAGAVNGPRGLGAGPAGAPVGRRPGINAPLMERLLAQSGQSPLAEARAATNPRDALAAFDRYLAANPNGQLREQAMVGRAGALESMGDRPQAAAAWREVLASYPHSMSAPQARRRLIALEH
jgi:hypothetical protein